jgi:hypothetical protein
MTADEARLFGQLFALLDSDQQGERGSSLEKIFLLRPKHNFPKFGDLLHSLNNTVPLADYQKLESDLATCLRHNQILRAVVNVRAVLRWLLGLTIAASVVGGIGYGGYCLFWPDTSAADELARGVLAEMQSWQDWPSKAFVGDSKPTVHVIAGRSYWIVIRGEMDKTSHADKFGDPAWRHCQHYFAAPAQYDVAPPADYLTPHPYSWLGHMKWPEVAAQCQQPSP